MWSLLRPAEICWLLSEQVLSERERHTREERIFILGGNVAALSSFEVGVIEVEVGADGAVEVPIQADAPGCR
jgi:hypothetical protein